MSRTKHELPGFLEYEETLGSLFHAMESNYQEGNLEVDIIRTITEIDAIKMEIAKASDTRFDLEMLSTGTGLEVVFSLYAASINGSNKITKDQITEVIENSVKAENLEELRNNADEQINYFLYLNMISETTLTELFPFSKKNMDQLIKALQKLEDISIAERYIDESIKIWEYCGPEDEEEATKLLINGIWPFLKHIEAQADFLEVMLPEMEFSC